MLLQLYYFGKLPREYTYPFALLLLISSIVIADPNSQLDLPDDFNNLNVDSIFSREESMREPKKEENEWRKPEPQVQKREVRWGTRNIYEANDDLDPFTPPPRRQGEIIRNPEASPQLEIRF